MPQRRSDSIPFGPLRAAVVQATGLPGLLDRRRHNKRGTFVFIHINKTAGSSIGRGLGLRLEHFTVQEKIEQIGRASFDERFTFAFVRNPWDRAVSHYHHRVRTDRTGLGSETTSFSDWLRAVHVDRDPSFRDREKMFMPQSEWLIDQDGEIAVDEVYRFEELANGFADACRRIGVEAELPHLKKSGRTDYRSYYADDRDIAIVEAAYASDVQRFGYSFDD